MAAMRLELVIANPDSTGRTAINLVAKAATPSYSSNSRRGPQLPKLERKERKITLGENMLPKRIESTPQQTGGGRTRWSPEIEVMVISRVTRTETQRYGTPSPGSARPAARAQIAIARRPAAAQTLVASATYKVHRRPRADSRALAWGLSVAEAAGPVRPAARASTRVSQTSAPPQPDYR